MITQASCDHTITQTSCDHAITGLHHRAPMDDAERVLLLMLPGAGIAAGDFAEQGLVAELHRRGLAVDATAADIALDHYLDGSLAGALDRALVAPAMAQGYTRIWLLGISLGGMGALLYASAYAARIEGMVLLAPFLGTAGTIAEIAAAGGLATWSEAGSAATATEIGMLSWLQAFLACGRDRPALYLGHGLDDRFASGHRMLAACLPPERVVTAGGGHDWPTWRALWQLVLDTAPFSAERLNGGDRHGDRP